MMLIVEAESGFSGQEKQYLFKVGKRGVYISEAVWWLDFLKLNINVGTPYQNGGNTKLALVKYDRGES